MSGEASPLLAILPAAVLRNREGVMKDSMCEGSNRCAGRGCLFNHPKLERGNPQAHITPVTRPQLRANYLAGLAGLPRPHDAGFLEFVHQPRCPRVSDSEPALQ